jgi:excisionase family DNA binding protein
MQSVKTKPAIEPIEFPATSTHSDPNGRHPSGLRAEERLLTPQEIADRLGVSERWVRDHATRRWPRITAVKLGSLLRFRWSDVEDFLAHNTLQGPSKKQVGGV